MEAEKNHWMTSTTIESPSSSQSGEERVDNSYGQDGKGKMKQEE